MSGQTANATTLGAAMRAARDQFRADGLENAALDARLLAQAAFGLDGAILTVHENDLAEGPALETLNAMAARRLKGEPVARILGKKEFYGLEFALNAATLVPRPETELLVDLGLEHLSADDAHNILDLGTGSGCIAIALLAHLPKAHAVGVDLSDEALSQANDNSRTLGVGSRFQARHGSWYGPVQKDERFELIVANPPYIAAREILGLDIEVSAYDPILALSAGSDGYEPFAPIISGAKAHLAPGGCVLLECGIGQADKIAGLCQSAGFLAVNTHNDLSGIARVVVAND